MERREGKNEGGWSMKNDSGKRVAGSGCGDCDNVFTAVLPSPQGVYLALCLQ